MLVLFEQAMHLIQCPEFRKQNSINRFLSTEVTFRSSLFVLEVNTLIFNFKLEIYNVLASHSAVKIDNCKLELLLSTAV